MDHPDLYYRSLRNCFIGHALSDEEHPSLPIISSAIFTCVAERLGLHAACLAFPSHVHAAVFAPPGRTLDGRPVEDPKAEPEKMCLDPYGSDNEITLRDLRRRLVEFGWQSGTNAFLTPSPVPIIVQRTAQNIKATHDTVHSLANTSVEEDRLAEELKRLRSGHPMRNLSAAVYASMWADLLMKQTTSFHWDTNLGAFLKCFALSWSEDTWIVRKYLAPLYEEFIANKNALNHGAAAANNRRRRSGWENLHEIVAMLENLDNRQPTVSRRYTADINARVRYRIGQVFRHRRYQYVGVINGWAATGSAGLPMPHYLDAAEAEEEGDVFDPTESVRASNAVPQRTFYTCLCVFRFFFSLPGRESVVMHGNVNMFDCW